MSKPQEGQRYLTLVSPRIRGFTDDVAYLGQIRSGRLVITQGNRRWKGTSDYPLDVITKGSFFLPEECFPISEEQYQALLALWTTYA